MIAQDMLSPCSSARGLAALQRPFGDASLPELHANDSKPLPHLLSQIGQH